MFSFWHKAHTFRLNRICVKCSHFDTRRALLEYLTQSNPHVKYHHSDTMHTNTFSSSALEHTTLHSIPTANFSCLLFRRDAHRDEYCIEHYILKKKKKNPHTLSCKMFSFWHNSTQAIYWSSQRDVPWTGRTQLSSCKCPLFDMTTDNPPTIKGWVACSEQPLYYKRPMVYNYNLE